MKAFLLGIVLLFIVGLIMTQFKRTRKYMLKDIARNEILKKVSSSSNFAEDLKELRRKEQMYLDSVNNRDSNLAAIEMAQARIEVINELLKRLS
ncbi:MAG: hypothetical protein ACI4NZ_00255 [Candidatus Enterousia sp.]